MCRFFVDVFFVGGVQTDIRWIYAFKNNTRRILERKEVFMIFLKSGNEDIRPFPVFNAWYISKNFPAFAKSRHRSSGSFGCEGVREDC